MSSTTACRFFQSPQGCFRGSSCTFRHDHEVHSNDVSLSLANPYVNGTIPTSNQPQTCHFFTADSGCRNGSNCPFAHLIVKSDNLKALERVTRDELAVSSLQPMAGVTDPVFYDRPGPTIRSHHRHVSSIIVTNPNKRKLHIQANPQKKETISEILPVFTRDIEGPFFAIDVECVATGNGTDDRDVARIAMVDEDEKVVFDQYVKPTKPIVSYLTQLTGITKSNLKDAPELKEALIGLKRILPVESVIIGQSIKKDLEWLTLQKPMDYKDEFDVADLFRLPVQATNGVVRYRYFSLRHVAKYLLGHDIQEADHNPVIDARYAMKIFNKFRHLHENPSRRDAVLQTLLKTPRTPSFADRFPVIDGVSMRVPRMRSTSPVLGHVDQVASEIAQYRTSRSQHGQPPSL
ncbi:putative Zinc finger, CCCH-type, ribonuclease H-like superfamily, Zinc finger, CCCH-type superfamily [Plasmopara halstedii]